MIGNWPNQWTLSFKVQCIFATRHAADDTFDTVRGFIPRVEKAQVGFREAAGRPAFSGHSKAFTLVELLVVIAIIGILIALLLPAVQAAREAARRTGCTNNLKQLTLALHNHLGAHKRFPLGAKNDPGYPSYGFNRQSWIVTLLPYIEERSIFERYDQKLRGGSNTNWYGTANSRGSGAPTAQAINAMLCPSDGAGLTHWSEPGNSNAATRPTFALGNYLAFFGDIAHDHGLEPTSAHFVGPPNKRHAFGINFGAKSKDFSDGMSKTLLLGEYLRAIPGNDYDVRGMFYQDESAGSQVYTQFTPNSSNPDAIFPGWCHNRPELNLPCTEDLNESCTSRSRHPGSVHVSFADGSVRLVSDVVDLRIWQAAGTLQGNESISAGNL